MIALASPHPLRKTSLSFKASSQPKASTFSNFIIFNIFRVSLLFKHRVKRTFARAERKTELLITEVLCGADEVLATQPKLTVGVWMQEVWSAKLATPAHRCSRAALPVCAGQSGESHRALLYYDIVGIHESWRRDADMFEIGKAGYQVSNRWIIPGKWKKTVAFTLWSDCLCPNKIERSGKSGRTGVLVLLPAAE